MNHNIILSVFITNIVLSNYFLTKYDNKIKISSILRFENQGGKLMLLIPQFHISSGFSKSSKQAHVDITKDESASRPSR